MKAEWRRRDFDRCPHPPREDYELFEELFLPSVGVVARIEQFARSSHCFYASTPDKRSGCISNYEAARQWCEHHSGNKRN